MPTSTKDSKKPKLGNAVRSMIFSLFIILCAAALISSFSAPANIEEVPISDIIARANDENGNIKKITVTGNTLNITLKGEENISQTSRKDPSSVQRALLMCKLYQP